VFTARYELVLSSLRFVFKGLKENFVSVEIQYKKKREPNLALNLNTVILTF
jgi:hypothetical protein